MNATDLERRWAALRQEDPRAHSRDAASRLGVSEAELVATGCGADATRLAGPFAPILGELGALGEVKTMTRNAAAVLERWGTYGVAELDTHVGQVIGEDIDLRIFPKQLGSAFAVLENGTRRSLQFFDPFGDSVHKVYLEDQARVPAFEAVVDRHRAADQGAEQAVEAPPPPATARPDGDVDVAGLQAGWDAMRDTHEFFGLLRRFGTTRTQALRLAGARRARPVAAAASLDLALSRASADRVRIMIFVPNRGMIQIHTGEVKNVRGVDDWLNVLDPRVNLHVRRSALETAWVAEKPTSDGIVTSLEIYDAEDRTVAFVFGERKPGKAEDERWRRIVADLPRAGDA